MIYNNLYDSIDEKNLCVTIEEMNIKFFDWLRNITTIATGLLAILVSLKSSLQQKPPDIKATYSIVSSGLAHYQQLFFFLTILLLSLAIAFSSVVLYQQVALLRSAALAYHSRIQKKQGQDPHRQDQPDAKGVAGLKSFPLLKRITFGLYFLGLISLVTYSYFISGL